MNPLRGLRPGKLLTATTAVVALTLMAGCSDDNGASSSGESGVAQPSASFPGNAASGTPIRIGLINNEGGQTISQPDNRMAAEAAADYANDQLGGIGGYPIELVTCLNAEEPASARDCANRMVESDVSAVVVTTTGQGDILVPIITGAGIPYVSASGQSMQELTNENSFLWSGGFPSSLQAMAAHAKTENMKNVTAFTIDVPAAVSGLQAFGAAAFEANGVNLNIVTIPPGTPDSTPQVSAGLADSPEGVVVVGEGTLCTSALKSLGTLGYDGEKMGIQACATPDVVASVGPSINGTKIFTAAMTTGDDPEAELYRSVIDKYNPETDISGYAYVGYQGVLGLVRATQSLDGTDTAPAAIAAAIRSAQDVVLPAGDGLTFTCNGSANPQLPAVCGKGSVVATLDDGNLTEAAIVGGE
ncbi:ABC transporter substrate-binding protein [Gordonia sp. HNM0687]|uniref:ABC transporter substrate-binding protein n=1 Tax=Gordonia mangrovi TaxID=2665643 RepID=A0A6L7GTJ2_9ACTN|nr:ABC transporter substrate-binding protein [Gordonia mangrovi]MXP23344.1 ABC transporter substrate-binding protein [Gordonia mangrovi]UVF76745.1 ABC transporter substrate-binding protein [Gordonia mangrovi]